MIEFKATNRPVSKDDIQKAQTALEGFLKRKEIGFKDLPERDSLWSESARWGQWIKNRSQQLVLIGIGGSSLGPQFLNELASSSIEVFISDNVDPWQFEKIRSRIRDWSRTSFLIISKSGTTLETLVSAELFERELKSRGLQWTDRALVITEPKQNSLADWAVQRKIQQLEIPFDVGGRFSILSPVGLVLASALDFSIEEMREGARLALKEQQKISQISAEAMASFQRGEWITFLWCYSSSLRYFGLWFQQLWAESLAKTNNRQGQPALRASTPLPALGACDQHSLLQQVMEGAKDKWVVQLRVKSCENSGPVLDHSQFSALSWLKNAKLGQILGAEAEATARALESQNVSLRSLELHDLSPRSVGYLLMHWQLVVACLGELLEINAFDQPGVELGKRLAREILQNTSCT